MVKLNAHFDGKVIIPDEPLNLQPNQRLRIEIEPIEAEATKPRTDWHSLIGIASSPGDRPYDPAEEDALWEKGMIHPQPESDQSQG